MRKITCEAGTTLRLDIRVFTDSTRTVIEDLTGKTLEFYACDTYPNPTLEITKEIGTGITVTNATAGMAYILLDPADTLLLGAAGGVMSWRLRLQDADDNIFSVESGRLKFTNPLLP